MINIWVHICIYVYIKEYIYMCIYTYTARGSSSKAVVVIAKIPLYEMDLQAIINGNCLNCKVNLCHKIPMPPYHHY